MRSIPLLQFFVTLSAFPDCVFLSIYLFIDRFILGEGGFGHPAWIRFRI